MLGVMSPRLGNAETQSGVQAASLDHGFQRKKRRIAAVAAAAAAQAIQAAAVNTADVKSMANEGAGMEKGVIIVAAETGKLMRNAASRRVESGSGVTGFDSDGQSRAAGIGADLLTEVFSRLPFEERLRTVPLVCKSWRSAARDPACWRSVDMEEWFARRVEEDYWWEFDCEPRVEFLLKRIVDRSCGQLRVLRTRHCSDEAIEYIASRCPLLTVLSIRNSPLVTDKFASTLAANCPEIRELDVSDCYNISNEALESLRRWKPCRLQIKPLVLYFFWQRMLRIYMSSCNLQS